MPALSVNQSGLPYPDPIHPILVHFVIAMVFFAFFCDVIGFVTRKHNLFEVSSWNMVVASVSIFLAIIMGQFEAGLAEPYGAVESVLDYHMFTGWSLGAIIVAVTAWRFVIRARNPLKVPPVYLGLAAFMICLVFLQVYLGTQLVWKFGLHVKPVFEATQKGLLR